MSKIIMCDIRGCNNSGRLCNIMYENTEIVPTGNSDYSSYEEKTVLGSQIDICEDHIKEFEDRIGKVLRKNEKGFYFPHE